MKIWINLLIIIASAGIGLAVGFAWRGKSGGRPNTSDVAASTAASPSASSANRFRFASKPKFVRTHDDSPLATQLEQDLSMSSGVTRWLYWLEAIEKATLSDFPAWSVSHRAIPPPRA